MSHFCCISPFSYSPTPICKQWRNRRGGAGGAEWLPENSDREIFADLPGKKRQGKNGKGGKMEKKRRKIVKGN